MRGRRGERGGRGGERREEEVEREPKSGGDNDRSRFSGGILGNWGNWRG